MLKLIGPACLLTLLSLAQPAVAAVNPVAGLANPLDNAGVSARALAMGSAFVGVADDSSALFWNPAGLSGLTNVELALHHNSWLADIVQETLVVGLPTGRFGGVGLSANYVNYGSFSGYDDAGVPTSDYSANRYGLGAGWGMELIPGLSGGLAMKGALRTVDDMNYADFSVDLGALWVPAPNARIGLSYSNLGTMVAGYNLASTLRFGGSYRFHLAPVNQLLAAASLSFEPRGVNRLNVGLEDIIYSFLALRLGYQANLADNEIEGLTGLSAGLGASFEGLSLDYAYLPFGDLGTTQRLSLSYKFGQGRKGRK